MAFLKTPRFRALLGLALVAAGLLGLALKTDLLHHPAWYASFYGLSAGGFALVATAITGLSWRVVIVAAVVLRLVFLLGTPSLSDDYYRYVWDGRVQEAGIDPYSYRPYEHALDGVPFVQRDLINHSELKTVYPPLTQAVFYGVARAARAVGQGTAGGASLRAEIVLLKLVFGAFDLATAAAIWWLAAGRLKRQATVLYLLCPAVILQTWESAHAEAAGVFFCVLAAALLVRRRDAWAGAALGAAAAFKVTPLGLLIPALLGGRASALRLLAGFAPVFLLPYVPFLLRGGAVGSLMESGTRWTGGSFVFLLFAHFVSASTARLPALAVFVAGAVWMTRTIRGREKTAEAFAWTMTLLVLCLPVVHAWYWLTPLALGVAAGLWLPLLIGMATPLLESLPLARWLLQLLGRKPVGMAVLGVAAPAWHRRAARRRPTAWRRVVGAAGGGHTETVNEPETRP